MNLYRNYNLWFEAVGGNSAHHHQPLCGREDTPTVEAWTGALSSGKLTGRWYIARGYGETVHGHSTSLLGADVRMSDAELQQLRAETAQRAESLEAQSDGSRDCIRAVYRVRGRLPFIDRVIEAKAAIDALRLQNSEVACGCGWSGTTNDLQHCISVSLCPICDAVVVLR